MILFLSYFYSILMVSSKNRFSKLIISSLPKVWVHWTASDSRGSSEFNGEHYNDLEIIRNLCFKIFYKKERIWQSCNKKKKNCVFSITIYFQLFGSSSDTFASFSSSVFASLGSLLWGHFFILRRRGILKYIVVIPWKKKCPSHLKVLH